MGNLTNGHKSDILFIILFVEKDLSPSVETIIKNGLFRFGDRMVQRGTSWYKP